MGGEAASGSLLSRSDSPTSETRQALHSPSARAPVARAVPIQMRRLLTSAIRVAARAPVPGMKVAKRLAVFALHHMSLEARVGLIRGGVLYVDLANAVGRTIWLRRDYVSEAPITNLVVENLHRGDVFLDIGANVGFFSLVAARIVGAEGRVVAFEPVPALANLLRKTAEANGLGNLDIVEAAVAQSNGKASIAAMRDSAYSHLVDGAREIDSSHGAWRSTEVTTICLDEFVPRFIGRAPRLIKMDIEGAELEALAGATKVLSDPHGPDVICEVGVPHLARFGHSPRDVFAWFADYGYAAFNPTSAQPMRVEDLSEHEYNVFFTRRRREH